jgi:hypothetical protein
MCEGSLSRKPAKCIWQMSDYELPSSSDERKENLISKITEYFQEVFRSGQDHSNTVYSVQCEVRCMRKSIEYTNIYQDNQAPIPYWCCSKTSSKLGYYSFLFLNGVLFKEELIEFEQAEWFDPDILPRKKNKQNLINEIYANDCQSHGGWTGC